MTREWTPEARAALGMEKPNSMSSASPDIFSRHGDVGARIVTVIETVTNRGKGVENDPIRPVICYWTFEGELLAEVDKFASRKEER